MGTRPRPARLAAQLRRHAPFAAYLGLQLLVVVGLTTPRLPDTVHYLSVSFTGSAQYPPTVPVLYNLLRSDPLRVFGQAVLATCAWWTVALVASRMVSDRRVRIGIRVVLLSLGVVGPIASWNTVLLSESAAISFTALLVAAWLHYIQRPSAATATLALLATFAWTFTRQPNVLIGLLATAIGLGAVVVSRRTPLRSAVALGLVAISLYGLVTLGTNATVASGDLADIVQDRILTNPSYTLWFVGHGMPDPPAVLRSAGGPWGDALKSDPTEETWLSSAGSRTYLEFLLTHPGYTLVDTIPYLFGERASLLEPTPATYPGTQLDPTPSLLSPDANYGRHHEVLPSVVQSMLFEQGQIGDVLALGAGAIILAVVARRRAGRTPMLWLPAVIAASAIPQDYLTWIAGGNGELDREAMVGAVCLRIGLWLVAALALDRILSAQARRNDSDTAAIGTPSRRSR